MVLLNESESQGIDIHVAKLRDILPLKIQTLVKMEEVESLVEGKEISVTTIPIIIIDLMKLFGKIRLDNLDKREMVTNIVLFLIRQSPFLTTGKDELCQIVPTLIDTFCTLANHRSEFNRGLRRLCC